MSIWSNYRNPVQNVNATNQGSGSGWNPFGFGGGTFSSQRTGSDDTVSLLGYSKKEDNRQFSYMYSPSTQTTTTNANTYTFAPQIQKTFNLISGSPYANLSATTKKEDVVRTQPSVSVIPSLTSSPSQSQSQGASGLSGMLDSIMQVAVIGGLVYVGFKVFKKVTKKK